MSRRRIAIIDHVGAKAGMDYYSGQLAQGLAQEGAACIVVSNFRVEAPSVKSYLYFAGHLRSQLRKGFNFYLGFVRAALRCLLSGYREAIVHLFSFRLKDLYALLLLRCAGIRTTVIVHDIESFANDDSQRLSRWMLHRLACRIVVHNQFSLEQLLRINGEDLKAKTKVIPHGHYHRLPSESPAHIDFRHQLGLREDIFYLLFFGQIKEVKGLEILLDALPHLPGSVQLVIAGKPWKNDFSRYEAQIQANGLNDRVVRMIRFIEDEERDALFKACDLLVLPYRQIFQSGVLLMGMSYRIPLVVSDLLPNRELIRDGENGWLFRSGDAADLAATLQQAISAPHQLAQAADRAWHDSADEHSWEEIAQDYLQW